MDWIKEFMEEHKLKIILGLLIIIVSLMIALFMVMGHHNNDEQTLNNQTVPESTDRSKSQSSKLVENHNNSHYQQQLIDIEGAVKRPGVYQFSNNMRIDDAVNLAGGLNASADRQHVNLAKKLIDQQTVYIPVKGEIKGLPGSASDSSSQTSSTGSDSGSGKVDLNSADTKQLQSVNGIGEKRAEKIIEYRKEHGNFKQVTDVKKISGIGDKFVDNIKDHVTV